MKLELKNVVKSFGDVVVLNNINIEFREGHIYGFVGRNGSGKSVLLKLICGFYVPTEGQILLDGVDYSGENSFPKDTRALIEKPNFLPDLTGRENLQLLASIQNKIGDKEIDDALEKVNISKDASKNYSKYSLGTKQKLGIAQVLMENPKIIILDEPFNGVENETATKIRKILIEEKEKGKIIIIASHIKEDIIDVSDIVYEVDAGNIKRINNKNSIDI